MTKKEMAYNLAAALVYNTERINEYIDLKYAAAFESDKKHYSEMIEYMDHKNLGLWQAVKALSIKESLIEDMKRQIRHEKKQQEAVTVATLEKVKALGFI